MGRYLERASATAILLEAYADDMWTQPDRISEDNEYLEWMGLLRSATAFEAYCKVYTADLTQEQILEFLLLDIEFPHSLRFSFDAMQQALESISRTTGSLRTENLARLSGKLQASLAYTVIGDLMGRGIVPYLRNIQQQCTAIHEAIYHLYIDYSMQAALTGGSN